MLYMEDIGTRIDWVWKSDYVQSQWVKSIVENDNVVNILEKWDTENIVLLTQDEWREYIQTKYAAEQFLWFSYERRIGLKIKWKWLLYIANTVFKLKLKNVVVKYNNFKKLAEAIYGENTIKIIENKKNKILEEKQKKLQVEWRNLIQDKYTVAQFFWLKEQVSGLKIKWKWLKYIAHTVFQLWKKYFNFNFNRLAITIYGEEMEVLIQQKSDEKNKILEEKQKKLQVEWRKFIQEEFTVAQFLGFDSEKRKEKIKRRWLYYIANTVFKLWWINPVFINKDFKILAKAIYGENNELINKSIEEEQTQSMSEEDKIKEEENQRKLQEKWRQIINEQYTKKQLLWIKRWVREKLKINWKWLCYIANTVFQLWFRNPSIYKQESIILIDVIFDKEVELTKNNFESYWYDTSTVGKVQEKVGNLLQEWLLLPNDDMLH